MTGSPSEREAPEATECEAECRRRLLPPAAEEGDAGAEPALDAASLWRPFRGEKRPDVQPVVFRRPPVGEPPTDVALLVAKSLRAAAVRRPRRPVGELQMEEGEPGGVASSRQLSVRAKLGNCSERFRGFVDIREDVGEASEPAADIREDVGEVTCEPAADV
mmetsp:Transcript_153742/g.492936  ORF Transcript_153742/g.492936 Transcript_153742/m.492936 type:complete len:162 (+) Transcript_153742:195-680(+)